MSSVQNYSAMPQVAFNGSKSNAPKTNKTHAGLKTGAIVATLSSAQALKILPGKAKLFALPAIAFPLVVGALADKFTNKKRAQFDTKIAELGEAEALLNDKRARKTKNGGVYYKTNQAKKIAPLAAAGVALASMLTSFTILRKVPRGRSILASLPLHSFIKLIGGGFLLGAVVDACANKNAKKVADKEALQSKEIVA